MDPAGQRQEPPFDTGALHRAIFNSANFSSIATDAKGIIQIFNVGAERMLGYTAAEVINKITPADISDPQEVVIRAETLSIEFATLIKPGFEALVFKASRGIEDIYELTYIRKDGYRFPAVLSVTALRDDQKNIIGYRLIGTDNTARKQAENEAQLANNYSRSLIEASLDPLVTISMEGKITDVLYNASVYRDSDDVVIGVFAAARDITKRKQVEEEQRVLDQHLRDQQFYTRSLIESSIDALMTTDPSGVITDVNNQMEAITDRTRDELIGTPIKHHFTDLSNLCLQTHLTSQQRDYISKVHLSPLFNEAVELLMAIDSRVEEVV